MGRKLKKLHMHLSLDRQRCGHEATAAVSAIKRILCRTSCTAFEAGLYSTFGILAAYSPRMPFLSIFPVAPFGSSSLRMKMCSVNGTLNFDSVAAAFLLISSGV